MHYTHPTANMASPPHYRDSTAELAPTASRQPVGKLSKDPERSPTPHFLRLPPELRNNIYDMLALEENPIAVPWPAITETCKRIRSETLSIYLGSNHFTATVIDRDHGLLLHWLDKFATLSDDERKLFKGRLMIIREGDMLNFELPHEIVSPHELDFEYSPNLDFWNTFIALLSASGLKAQRLNWPGHTHLQKSSRVSRPGGSRYSHDREKYLFNKFVLTPLLAAHGLLDERRPPIDIEREIASERWLWVLKTLGWEKRTLLSESRELVRDALGRCRGNPYEWYRDWCASRSSTQDDGACSRDASIVSRTALVRKRDND